MSGEKIVHPGTADAPVSALLGAEWVAMRFTELTRIFAKGRVSCKRYNRPPDAPVPLEDYYAPRVAGRNVSLAGEGFGYPTQREALAAARRYRDLCRAQLHLADGPKGQDGPVNSPGMTNNSHPGEGQ